MHQQARLDKLCDVILRLENWSLVAALHCITFNRGWFHRADGRSSSRDSVCVKRRRAISHNMATMSQQINN